MNGFLYNTLFSLILSLSVRGEWGALLPPSITQSMINVNDAITLATLTTQFSPLWSKFHTKLLI